MQGRSHMFSIIWFVACLALKPAGVKMKGPGRKEQNGHDSSPADLRFQISPCTESASLAGYDDHP